MQNPAISEIFVAASVSQFHLDMVRVERGELGEARDCKLYTDQSCQYLQSSDLMEGRSCYRVAFCIEMSTALVSS